MKNSGGLKNVNMEIIKGNHTPATEIKETEVLKLFRAVGLKYQNLKIQPQRLIVQAPYDFYGRPLTEFTINSRLLTQLPQNTQCALESLYISNFCGNSPHTLNFIGNITAQTSLLVAGDTSTFTNVNFGTVIPKLYDYFTILVPDPSTPTVTFNVMFYLSTISNYALGTVIGTVIDPASLTATQQVPNLGVPSFPMGIKWDAQQLAINYMGYTTTTSGFSGFTNINVELLGYSNPNIWDTGLNNTLVKASNINGITSNVGNYSNIIASVPCSKNVLSESSNVSLNSQSTQLNFFQVINFNTPAYQIKDPNFLNNSQIQFRLTYNQGGKDFLLPQPIDSYAICPYNLAASSSGSTASTIIPYGSIYDGITWTDTAVATIRAGYTFNTNPVVRFTLVFYPMVGVEQIDEI